MGVPALTQPYSKGLGIQEPFKIAPPGANTNASFVCDGRGLRRLTALVFVLTTDGTAANRYVTVEYIGGDGIAYAVDAAAVTVSASSTQRFVGSAQRGDSEWNTNTDVLFPLSPIFLYPGDLLQIIVAAKQAGDTLTKIRGTMERFPLDWYDLPAENA